MRMPPIPISLLIFFTQFTEVAVLPMIFRDPSVVIHAFMVVPNVIVPMIGIVNPIPGVHGTAG